MAGRLGAFGLIVVLVTSISGVAGPGAANAATSPVATDNERAQIVQRSMMAFNIDLEYVRLVDASADSDSGDIGVPISPDEHQEMQRRRALGAHAPTIDAAFDKETTYAGSWMSQSEGGVLHVAFTSTPSAGQRVLLNSLLSPTEQFVTSTGAQSLAALEATQTQVTADLSSRDLPLVASSIDIPGNSVVVTIAVDAPANEEQIVTQRYKNVKIETKRGLVNTTDGSRDIRSGRVYGGEWISSNQGFRCTNTYTDAKSATNETYGLSAGHCGPIGTTWVQGLGGTRYIGTVHTNGTFGHSSTICDCAAIGPTPIPGYGTNQVLVNNNNLFTYTRTGSPYVGEVACHSGAASFELKGVIQCATIGDIHATSYECDPNGGNCFSLFDAIRLPVFATSGDSGGPLGDGGSFLGLLSGGGTNDNYFSKALNVNQINLTLSYAS